MFLGARRTFVLTLVVFVVLAILGFANIPKPKPPQDWEIALQKKPITIAKIGAVPQVNVENVTFVQYTQNEITMGQFDAIWMNENETTTFNTEEGKQRLNGLLSNGKVILVLGKNPHVLFSLFGANYNEELDEKTSNVKHVGYYVWKDGSGSVNFGIVGVTKDASEEISNEALLEQTVNHMSSINSNVTKIRLATM